MAITTKLQTKYTLQKVFVILVCLVMGLWGVYDYKVKIPMKERAYERGQVCLKTKTALEPGNPVDEAQAAIDEQLQKLLEFNKAQQPTAEEAQRAIESIKARNEDNWLMVLLIFQKALAEAPNRSPDTPPSQEFAMAFEIAKAGVDNTADVTRPGRFDLATQWMFILCLPFVPYFAWSLNRARKRVYTLDDDGTLHAPEGTWPKDQIADIDMSRWMSKSIAEVKATDGTGVKMDDYVYRNTHLIVGAIASERYPDDWDAEARQQKRGVTDEAATETEASDEASEDSDKAAASLSAP